MDSRKFQRVLAFIATLDAIIVASMIVIICLIRTFGSEHVTFSDIKEQHLLNGKRVTITGYMSPLLAPTKNYFYLTQVPYDSELNFPKEEQAIAVYVDVAKTEKNGVFEYTSTPITVTGTLICGQYIDNNGFEHQQRIINATVKDYTDEKYQKYIDIASAQVYSDVWMYYNLLETIVTEQVSEEEIVEIQESHLEDMLLYLVMTQYGDDSIVGVIDKELGLIQQVNDRIGKSDYEFTDLQEEVKGLKEEITSYFEQWSVE